MSMGQLIELKRECEAIEIPSGIRRVLPAGTMLRISQFLGSSYTVVSEIGYMCRIDAKDADALGLPIPNAQKEEETLQAAFSQAMVWDQLKTVYDPEIPVNIVDLGLIYSCEVTTRQDGGKKIDVRMSMTAPGCGMGNVLRVDVESKLSRLPEVKEVNVQVVFDPPWHPGLMSEAARLQLGFDLDIGARPITRISR
jgi:probable FeS assembly SUF system protein SufT